jgi:hypothetical protein
MTPVERAAPSIGRARRVGDRRGQQTQLSSRFARAQADDLDETVARQLVDPVLHLSKIVSALGAVGGFDSLVQSKERREG